MPSQLKDLFLAGNKQNLLSITCYLVTEFTENKWDMGYMLLLQDALIYKKHKEVFLNSVLCLPETSTLGS